MRRKSLGLVLAGGLGVALMGLPAAGSQWLSGHVPAATAGLQAVGRLPATNRLSLALALPLRNQEQLAGFLRDLYDPASTNYHRYLTPPRQTIRRSSPLPGRIICA
jgi:hypothetical protein